MEHAMYLYLRAQAKRCYAIARTCRDLKAASDINAVGNTLRRKAAELANTARHRKVVPIRSGLTAGPEISAASAARR
jgi:hypothetical protein